VEAEADLGVARHLKMAREGFMAAKLAAMGMHKPSTGR